MAQDAVIRTNKVRDIFDWGVKFVHGAKNGLVEDNDIGAAGTGSIVVSGTSEPSYGDTTGQLIRNNRITQVGGLDAFCGSAVPAPYQHLLDLPDESPQRRRSPSFPTAAWAGRVTTCFPATP